MHSPITKIVSIPYLTAIATGHIPGRSIFRSLGQRQSLSTIVTGDDVWEGTATILPIPADAGEQMTIVSTSVDDTSNGSGVRTINIEYLNSAGVVSLETVTLNGLTPVNTVATNIRFVQTMHSASVGSGRVAAGTINIYKIGFAATIYNCIVAGGNMSLTSSRMIPVGKTFYLTNLSITGASNKPLSVKLRATSTIFDILIADHFFLFKDVSFIQNSVREKNFSMPLKFPALSILKVTTYSTQAGGDISIEYEGWLESNG